MPKELKVGVIGATGYTGSELLRILHGHPNCRITQVTSESHAGKKLGEVHPFLGPFLNLSLIGFEDFNPEACDVIFLALPHGVSMEFAKQLQDSGLPCIDFSGDFRLSSAEIYQDWYQKPHTWPEGIAHACYGLPEWNAERISSASLIANPGCYPTASLLALLPFAQTWGDAVNRIIIDAKSGVTGAGVRPSPSTHFPGMYDNFKAYGLGQHRHTIEIQEQLQAFAPKLQPIQFTPHLLPVDRGILATVYLENVEAWSSENAADFLKKHYAEAPFVHVVDGPPSLKDVRGSNHCLLHVQADTRTNQLLLVSVIDNLVKGAAGQAIQNMNLRFGFPQETGLQTLPLNP